VSEPRIAFRCDGGDAVGAGHVARCLPLAAAFADLGWRVEFVGGYDGLAGRLLDESPVRIRRSEPRDGPAGIDPAGGWRAAVVDRYDVAPEELCVLAAELPLATMAEASRCESAGIVVDYHLDRAAEPGGPRLLAGPRWAPLDPRLLGARRSRPMVKTVLVTAGASGRAPEAREAALSAVRGAFPDAEVAESYGPQDMRRFDLAVSAAGFTAYELACAGVPAVVFALAENQRRVVEGCARAGVALVAEGDGEGLEASLADALGFMADPALRARLAKRGTEVFDGLGAARAAAELAGRWDAGPVR
jgi:UDP-2,4-diacetamido-2,4,6-trideoxy-beta-L-altropyranose hydrolase